MIYLQLKVLQQKCIIIMLEDYVPEHHGKIILTIDIIVKQILMKYYLGLTHKQIGRELHIGAKAAQKRTERAVERLKKIMGGEGYEL